MTKARNLGVTGIGASVLVTSAPAIAHGGVPAFVPTHASHTSINASQFVRSAATWQVPTSHRSEQTPLAVKPSAAVPWHGNSLWAGGGPMNHPLSNPSGTITAWANARQASSFEFPNAASLGGTALNLQSVSKNILLGSSVFQGAPSVTIKVGAKELTFTPGQKVTAAEYLAINEVVSSGTQTLKLNGAGVAVGGTFSFSNTGGLRVSDLVIPVHVTALDNLSGQYTLSLSGDLLNYGALYGYSSPGQNSSGQISAREIVNERSGLISTQLPASLVSSIGGTLADINLTLNADGAITNAGKIVSGGSLNLVMGSGILNNSGMVSSASGNINILTHSPLTDITVTATGGTFQAQNGAIALRQSDYTGGANVNLVGGNYQSNSLNIFSGSGTISGNVENVSGQINSQAGVEHLAANSANLILGTNTVTGDPTFVNNGNITISGVNTFSEDVTIIANGNITGINNAAIVDSGHNIILIAGVAPGAGKPSSGSVTGKSPGISGSTTIDFASSSNKGGNIDFTAGYAGTVIDTSSSTYTAGGGNVTLASFAKGTTGGSVLFNSSSTINTSASIYGGTGTNNGGNVTIIAGAKPTTGAVTVQVGNITTSGSNGQGLSGFVGQPTAVAGKGGTVNISTSQPTATGGTTASFNSGGAITAGGPIIPSGTINDNAQVTVGNILTGAPGQGGPGAGGDINILAGGNIATGSLSTYGTTGAPFLNFQSGIPASVGGNAGNIAIQSINGGIGISGAINSVGGAGGNGGTMSGFGSSQSFPAAAGGNGGNVTLQSSTELTIGGGISTNGGLGGSGVAGNPASAGGAGGNGGSIAASTKNGNISVTGNLSTVGGAGGNGGNGLAFSLPPAGAIDGVGGSDGGKGGQIQVNAGKGQLSITGGIDSSGGAGGNGGDGFHGSPNSPNSTAGGQGGNGGKGGAAGAITVQAGSATIASGIKAIGGAGGSGGAGGDGVVSPPTSAGGNGGSGGDGGAAGVISFVANNFSGPLTAQGGAGGAAGADGVSAPGGSSGTPGKAGTSADISVTAGGATSGVLTGSNITIGSPAGVSLILSDDVTASGALKITSGASVQITGSTQIAGTSVAINGVSGNDLTVSVNSASGAIVANSGDITVTGATGNSVIINNAGTFSTLSGNIHLSSTEAVVSSNAGGNIIIGGGGTFKVTSGTIDVNANTQSGSPEANKIEFSGSQTLMGNTVLNAGGQTQLVQIDNGATVVGTATVTVNSSTLFEIGSGTLTGNPLVVNSLARGGVIANTSGTLDLSTLGPLVFNGQSLAILSVGSITDNGNTVKIDLSSSTAAGGNLSLLAGYNFTPNGGSLNYPPLDTTSTFVITGSSTGSINLGNTSIDTSGKTSAGGVLAVANGTITLGTISTTSTTGTGGSVNIIGSGVSITGNIDTTSAAGAQLGGRVSISAANPVSSATIVVGGGFVAGGSFSPGTASGSITVSGIDSGAAAISLVAMATGANITTTNQLSGGNISLATSGTITLASNQPFTVQNDSIGNGGSLALSANSLSWGQSASQPLSLDASAGGAAGNGGSIVVSLQSSAPVNIGTQAGQIQLSASGGVNTGSGGAVTFSTGGNLTVSPAGLDIGPGATNSNGGKISLEAGSAGSGNLLVTGALSANGSGSGNGGTISLISKSATTFNIGSTAKTNTNGVLGGLSVAGAGGSLTIINGSSGITNAIPLNAVENLTESAGGTGVLALGSSLSANKGLQTVSLTVDKGAITQTGSLTTAKIVLQSTGGNIGTSGAGFSVVAGEVQASALGLINITDKIKSNVTLDASTAGTSFKLLSSGALTIKGTLASGTSTTLTTSGTNLGITIGGDLTVSSATGTAVLTATGKGIISETGAGGTIKANTVTLKTTSGTVGTPVRALAINAAVLNLTTTGAVNVANVGTASLTVNGSATKGTFNLNSDGSIIIAKAMSSATAYSLITNTGSNGDITVNAAVGGNNASSIIAVADGSGSITSSTTGKFQTKVNGTITLSSGTGNIGSGTTTKTTLNIYTTNLAANTGGTGVVNVASKLSSAVAIKKSTSGGAFNLYTAGSSALDGITSSGGSITVIEKTGTLTVNGASTIHAGNGSIVLENDNKSSGIIAIGNGSKITTMSTSTNGGQVSIVIGPVPTNPVVGTAPPSGLTVNQVSGGSVFFGKGITVSGPVNTINLQGSNVVFNVGTRPITAITLGGGVTITADPVPTSIAQPDSAALASPSYALSPAMTKSILPAPPTIAETTSMAKVSNYALIPERITTEGIVSSINSSLPLTQNVHTYGMGESRWLSETELQSGEIPAVLFEGDSLGIKNEISSILELEELANGPLIGSVTKDAPAQVTKAVKLKRGSVIFAATRDTVVNTPAGTIKVAANSVAMVMAFSEGVAVYNLFDKHKDAIIFETAKKRISIMPGGMTIVSTGAGKNLALINPTQTIGYRNLQTSMLDDNVQTFSGQFSMRHAIVNILPLRDMIRSKDAQASKIGCYLLKTAAILDQLNGADYQYFVKPTVTASLH
ncbi:MAG: hypothetical protein JSS83_05035 [Cyanobacteria bacterium SZAS LIN-3]|nr:hypothetical protein [Cyanobacteria bacterium SZAS LIN-3]